MLYYTNYYGHDVEVVGKRKDKLKDNTVYTFDIETTSYFILNTCNASILIPSGIQGINPL